VSDYVCIPVEPTNGALNIISFASKHKIGFSYWDIVFMAALLKPLRMVLELMTCHQVIDDVDRTYLWRRCTSGRGGHHGHHDPDFQHAGIYYDLGPRQ
jgi:hypothetical protein